jgi:tetratricopeptide (TPR) repeat protein
VLLVLVENDDGAPIAQGSAFLAEGGIVVTNAHVVRGGKAYFRFGPAKVPVSIEKIDNTADLAILRCPVNLSATPIPFAAEIPHPGDTVYTLGNPEGLERSISNGVVSAVRDISGYKLLQITSAISPGSSGGPVLNSSGEVVGVAVAMMREGQNLNFAIPISAVRILLRSDSSNPRLNTIDEIVTRVKEIEANEGRYSHDQESQFWRAKREMRSLLQDALDRFSNNEAALLKIADAAHLTLLDEEELRIKALRQAVNIAPSATNLLSLATALRDRGTAPVGVDDREEAELLSEAEVLARKAISLQKKPTIDSVILLGNILVARSSYTEAEKLYKHALRSPGANEDKYNASEIWRGLIECYQHTGRPQEAEKAFASLKAVTEPWSTDWSRQAEMLSVQKRYSEAGPAYEEAIRIDLSTPGSGDLARGWMCDAADAYFQAGNEDKALSLSRQCIDAPERGFPISDARIASAYSNIAYVLQHRGVYDEALENAKKAAELEPNNGFHYYLEAKAFLGLRQFDDAAIAAKHAISLTDGKFASMHFALGSALFEQKQWEQARQSFEKASELDKTDSSAPYNVALCLERLGYHGDAARWYEEVLRRDPNHKDRQDIKRRIDLLRR